MTFWFVIALGWIGCGVLAAGVLFAEFQADRMGAAPYRETDWRFALLAGVFGPVALIAALVATNGAEKGWRLR